MVYVGLPMMWARWRRGVQSSSSWTRGVCGGCSLWPKATRQESGSVATLLIILACQWCSEASSKHSRILWLDAQISSYNLVKECFDVPLVHEHWPSATWFAHAHMVCPRVRGTSGHATARKHAGRWSMPRQPMLSLQLSWSALADSPTAYRGHQAVAHDLCPEEPFLRWRLTKTDRETDIYIYTHICTHRQICTERQRCIERQWVLLDVDHLYYIRRVLVGPHERYRFA